MEKTETIYEKLQRELETHTVDEVMESNNLTKTKFNQLVKEGKIKPLYCRRTPITNGLIPIDSPLAKLVGKQRADLNDYGDTEKDYNARVNREKEIREKELKSSQYSVGTLSVDIARNQSRLDRSLEQIAYQTHMINVLDLIKTDYVGFLEEESYGVVKPIEKFSIDVITDEMVIGYLAERLGDNVALTVSSWLTKQK